MSDQPVQAAGVPGEAAGPPAEDVLGQFETYFLPHIRQRRKVYGIPQSVVGHAIDDIPKLTDEVRAYLKSHEVARRLYAETVVSGSDELLLGEDRRWPSLPDQSGGEAPMTIALGLLHIDWRHHAAEKMALGVVPFATGPDGSSFFLSLKKGWVRQVGIGWGGYDLDDPQLVAKSGVNHRMEYWPSQKAFVEEMQQRDAAMQEYVRTLPAADQQMYPWFLRDPHAPALQPVPEKVPVVIAIQPLPLPTAKEFTTRRAALLAKLARLTDVRIRLPDLKKGEEPEFISPYLDDFGKKPKPKPEITAIVQYSVLVGDQLLKKEDIEQRRLGANLVDFASGVADELNDKSIAMEMADLYLHPFFVQSPKDDLAERLVREMFRVYYASDQHEKALYAADLFRQHATNSNLSDLGRIHMSQALEKLGRYDDAIAILNDIADDSSVIGAKRHIPEIEKLRDSTKTGRKP